MVQVLIESDGWSRRLLLLLVLVYTFQLGYLIGSPEVLFESIILIWPIDSNLNPCTVIHIVHSCILISCDPTFLHSVNPETYHEDGNYQHWNENAHKHFLIRGHYFWDISWNIRHCSIWGDCLLLRFWRRWYYLWILCHESFAGNIKLC